MKKSTWGRIDNIRYSPANLAIFRDHEPTISRRDSFKLQPIIQKREKTWQLWKVI
jgi:hypothetical protein